MTSQSSYLNLPLRSEEEAREDVKRDTDALDLWRERQALREWAHGCNALARALFPNMGRE